MMDFKKIALEIQNEIGDRAEIKALTNGVQAKPVGVNFQINFYYGQKGFKLCRSDNNFTKPFDKGQEAKEILNQISYIKKADIQVSKPTNVIEMNDKGTEACIAHVKKRYDVGIKNKVPIILTNMLKQLQIELEQYL